MKVNFSICYTVYERYRNVIKYIVGVTKKESRTCAFSGRRPQNLSFGFQEEDERCIALKQVLREEIIYLIEREGVTHFTTGLTIGVDMYADEMVIELKARSPMITLESAIPCETQAAKWSEDLRDR